MLIAQLGHIVELGCRRSLDPARQQDQARNQDRVDEFLTRRMIAELLDAMH